jgi:hypothetical protein
MRVAKVALEPKTDIKEFLLSITLFALVISETTAEGVYSLLKKDLTTNVGLLSILNFLRLASTGIATPLTFFKGEIQVKIRSLVTTACCYIGALASMLEAVIVYTNTKNITTVSTTEVQIFLLSSVVSVGGFGYMWYYVNIITPTPAPTFGQNLLLASPTLDLESAVFEQKRVMVPQQQTVMTPLTADELERLVRNNQIFVPYSCPVPAKPVTPEFT